MANKHMPDNINDYVISATSSVTAVGGNALQTCAAARANIIGVSEHPVYRCKPLHPDEEKPLPLYCCRVPFINETQEGPERLLQLAVPALREAVANAKLTADVLAFGKLFVALPEPDNTMATWGLEQGFCPSLCQRVGIYPIQSRVKFGGHTSVFELLADAFKALEQDDCEFCIVGGVDSFLFKHRLTELDKNWFLRSKKNIDGFIPGEAASFIVIEKSHTAEGRGAHALARIDGLGVSNEPNTATSGRKSSGVGLTNAIHQASANRGHPFKTVYSDLNGESYRAFEWGLAQVRAMDYLNPAFKLLHPAESYGDVGTATGALLLTLATHDLQPKEHYPYTPKSVMLFSASHHGGTRVAASLSSIG